MPKATVLTLYLYVHFLDELEKLATIPASSKSVKKNEIATTNSMFQVLGMETGYRLQDSLGLRASELLALSTILWGAN